MSLEATEFCFPTHTHTHNESRCQLTMYLLFLEQSGMVWLFTQTHTQILMCLCFAGRPVPHYSPVPVHRLAGTGRAKVWWRLHRFHRPSTQDKRAVRSRRTNHSALQVRVRADACERVQWILILVPACIRTAYVHIKPLALEDNLA